MAEQILFIGPIARQGGPAIKNSIMVRHLAETASLKIYNTYDRSLRVRLGAVHALLSAREKFVIISVSRKGRNLLYPILLLKKKLHGIRYCCIVIGGNVRGSFRTKASVKAMQEADMVTLETRGLERDIRSAYSLSNTCWLPNYKELDKGAVTGFPPEHFEEKPLRFLFLSSMRNVKGVKTLLRAFQRVLAEGAPAELDYYGPIRDDLDRELLEEIEKAEHIRYCGAVENRQVLETMRRYHIFVFPTEYTGEGFPAVLVEAMASGLPVIASDMNDDPEIIQEGRNGWIFPRGEEEELADCIRYCVRNRKDLFTVSENNLVDMLQYEAGTVLKKFAEELRDKGWPV